MKLACEDGEWARSLRPKNRDQKRFFLAQPQFGLGRIDRKVVRQSLVALSIQPPSFLTSRGPEMLNSISLPVCLMQSCRLPQSRLYSDLQRCQKQNLPVRNVSVQLP